jgi:hypothetical protein
LRFQREFTIFNLKFLNCFGHFFVLYLRSFGFVCCLSLVSFICCGCFALAALFRNIFSRGHCFCAVTALSFCIFIIFLRVSFRGSLFCLIVGHIFCLCIYNKFDHVSGRRNIESQSHMSFFQFCYADAVGHKGQNGEGFA